MMIAEHVVRTNSTNYPKNPKWTILFYHSKITANCKAKKKQKNVMAVFNAQEGYFVQQKAGSGYLCAGSGECLEERMCDCQR